MTGLLIFNKPAGMTSRAAVDLAEKWFPGERVGHAGTLDPMATGVLVICLGQATRLVEYVQRMPKTYQAGIRLGAASDTDDALGALSPYPAAAAPTADQVREALNQFLGDVEQTPPAHSAIHVGGRRAYELARKGKTPPLEPRRVSIHRIQLDQYCFPKLAITVDCGKGTYIRSLARDLGRALGSGGYLESLVRTRIGPFRLEDALPADADRETARARLLPPGLAVSMLPAVTLDSDQLERLRRGQVVRLNPLGGLPPAETELAVFSPAGSLAALARWRPGESTLIPAKVFAP